MADASPTLDQVINNGKSAAVETAKELVNVNLDAKRQEADKIIRRYALFCSATGFIPVVGVDVVAVTALQTQMIRELADVYEFEVDDQLVRMAINNGVTAIGGRLLTELAGVLATSFSPLKMFLNGATQAAVSGFLTLEIGNIYQHKMELGENPTDISVMDIVNHIISQVQEGKWDPQKLSLTSQIGSFMNNGKN